MKCDGGCQNLQEFYERGKWWSTSLFQTNQTGKLCHSVSFRWLWLLVERLIFGVQTLIQQIQEVLWFCKSEFLSKDWKTLRKIMDAKTKQTKQNSRNGPHSVPQASDATILTLGQTNIDAENHYFNGVIRPIYGPWLPHLCSFTLGTVKLNWEFYGVWISHHYFRNCVYWIYEPRFDRFRTIPKSGYVIVSHATFDCSWFYIQLYPHSYAIESPISYY